uniref:Uncharacterized protein n=1 Tax=Angiostrongylus cantonensis TaxID=6313 RepID=C7TNX9_ANGCA|nr:hypothetical protein [Angiostrongylus cantonensis]
MSYVVKNKILLLVIAILTLTQFHCNKALYFTHFHCFLPVPFTLSFITSHVMVLALRSFDSCLWCGLHVRIF